MKMNIIHNEITYKYPVCVCVCVYTPGMHQQKTR